MLNSGACMAMNAAFGLLDVLLVKKLPARVTNTGKVVTGDRPTKNQVEAAVRESRETPPDRVEDRIREQL